MGSCAGDAIVAALRDGPGRELDDGRESLSRVELIWNGGGVTGDPGAVTEEHAREPDRPSTRSDDLRAAARLSCTSCAVS